MSDLVSSGDDLLDFSTPSSEGLETLSSEDDDASSSRNASHTIKPLSTFTAAGIPKPSPRSHSPDKSFINNGGTAVTSSILSVLSSYRRVPGGRRGRGGGVRGGELIGTLPHGSKSNTHEYEGDDHSLEGSMMSTISPASTKVIFGYMGSSSNQLVPPQSGVTFEHNGEGESGGSCDEPQSPVESALFSIHKNTHLPPQSSKSFSLNRARSEGHISGNSRDDSRDTTMSAPANHQHNSNNNARLRHLASTVKQSAASVSVMNGSSSALSSPQQKQLDDLARKRQKEDDVRKAKLFQFLGGGASKAKGVVGD